MNKLAIILTALILATFSIKASASSTATIGEIKYELYENYAIVTEYLSYDKNVMGTIYLLSPNDFLNNI